MKKTQAAGYPTACVSRCLQTGRNASVSGATGAVGGSVAAGAGRGAGAGEADTAQQVEAHVQAVVGGGAAGARATGVADAGQRDAAEGDGTSGRRGEDRSSDLCLAHDESSRFGVAPRGEGFASKSLRIIHRPRT